MKIALCFSGQPRSFLKSYSYYKKNLLDVENVDVFIHSWNSAYNREIIELYQPKGCLFEDYLQGDFSHKYSHNPNPKRHPPKSTVCSFYSIFQSCLLKINYEIKNSIYNWVIKTRFDFALNRKIPFAELDHESLYIPNSRISMKRDFGNDQFAVGSSHVMNDYMSTYIHLEMFYQQGIALIGEDMMSANIKKCGLIGKKLVYMDMHDPFQPGIYDGLPHSLIRDDLHSWMK